MVLFQNCLLWLFGSELRLWKQSYCEWEQLCISLIFSLKAEDKAACFKWMLPSKSLCSEHSSEPLFLSQENTRNWVFRLPLHWLPRSTYFQPRMTLWEVSVCVGQHFRALCLDIYLTSMNSTWMVLSIIKLLYISLQIQDETL